MKYLNSLAIYLFFPLVLLHFLELDKRAHVLPFCFFFVLILVQVPLDRARPRFFARSLPVRSTRLACSNREAYYIHT